MGRVVSAVVWLVVSIALSLAATAALNGISPARIPQTVQHILAPPGQPLPRPTVDPRTDAQMIALTRKACAGILSTKRCASFPVSVANLGGAEAGAANYVDRYVTDGTKTTSTLVAKSVQIDSSLRTEPDAVVLYVAAHEWHHIRSYDRAKTPARLKALSERANAYFQPRAREGITLAGTTGGIELLTDCAAVIGSDRPMPEDYGPTTAYVQQYLTSTDMASACGTGWADLDQDARGR